jgi:hypothetical protein
MLDRNVVAVSPSSVYRVLRQAGLIDRHSGDVPGIVENRRWRFPPVSDETGVTS